MLIITSFLSCQRNMYSIKRYVLIEIDICIFGCPQWILWTTSFTYVPTNAYSMIELNFISVFCAGLERIMTEFCCFCLNFERCTELFSLNSIHWCFMTFMCLHYWGLCNDQCFSASSQLNHIWVHVLFNLAYYCWCLAFNFSKC